MAAKQTTTTTVRRKKSTPKKQTTGQSKTTSRSRGGAVTPISVAVSVDGEPRLTSRAIYTPAAVDEYGNVTSTALVTVPKGCCFAVSVRYVDATTDDAAVTPTPVISVQNANLVINRVA